MDTCFMSPCPQITFALEKMMLNVSVRKGDALSIEVHPKIRG
jgi:hypothetical protein